MASFLRRKLRALARLALIGIGKLIARPVRRHLRHFEAATHDPALVQAELLRRILNHQQTTAFGQDHHFLKISNIEDFRRNISIAGYDAIESYIARMHKGEFTALVSDPVHMFALTSGTTASRKYIPVTSQYLADYRRGWNIWGLNVFRDHPEVKLRPIVQMSGDWNECQTEAQTPCGAVTGLTARMQKRIIRWLYCVPPEAGAIKDALAKYYLVLRLSMPRSVGMLIAANPSTLINLARLGDDQKERLIRDIHDGTLSSELPIPDSVRQVVKKKIRKKNPNRAQELEAIVDRTGHLYPKDYWHDFLLGNWTGGSVGAYLRHYEDYFGEAPVRDVGLIASEGRMTIPMEDDTSSGVLDITSHFFEFIPEEEIESSDPTVLLAHELKQDRNYFILPTTSFGLYRYQIYDVVRVTGFMNQTPLIEFLSKGAHIANLTGEKLSEHQVLAAMRQIEIEQQLSLGIWSLAPCWPEGEMTPHYGLFVEESSDLRSDVAARLDEKLAESNIEYAAKRESLRLGEIQLKILPQGTWQKWDLERLQKNGGTMEQYKHPALINDLKLQDSLPVIHQVNVS